MARRERRERFSTIKDCLSHIATLEQALQETEETLAAIRGGEVDAIVVTRDGVPRVYTLENADWPYRALIEQMHEGAITVSSDGVLLYCNRRFAEMVRLPHERVPSASLDRFVSEADRETLARLMDGSAEGGSRGELVMISSDGTEIPVYLSLVDLANEGERIICGVVADLSEQKQRMRELHGLSERLVAESRERERAEAQLRQAQKMEVVGQLTGGIAHDFNNLLMVIIGNLQRAQERASDDRLAQRIRSALLAADRGARLTRQLLAFSRRQNLRPESLSVGDFLSGMETLVRSTIGAEIAVDFVPSAKASNCHADPNQLEAALFNLVINARDAMPRGGRITIRTEEVVFDQAAADGIPNASPGRYVRIGVADTGTGMTPEVLARVFEPFFTTKDTGKGSGLGLSQVYGFVQQSGGAVTIASEPGIGTEVSLFLPLAEASAAKAGRACRTTPLAESQPMTVLVVEDDPAVRQLTTELFEVMGHSVLSAGDAAQALAVIEGGADIQLLFTDIILPNGVNGFDLAREVQRRRKGTAILLTSGFTATAIISDPSFEDFEILWKPFRQEDLALAISTAIDRAHRRQTGRKPATQPGRPRILAVEDDILIAILLEQMLTELDCAVVGPIARLADAMEAVQRDSFDAALLDVKIGADWVYPVADALAARDVPFAFITGFGETSWPPQHQNRPSLTKPYDVTALKNLLRALLPDR